MAQSNVHVNQLLSCLPKGSYEFRALEYALFRMLPSDALAALERALAGFREAGKESGLKNK